MQFLITYRNFGSLESTAVAHDSFFGCIDINKALAPENYSPRLEIYIINPAIAGKQDKTKCVST